MSMYVYDLVCHVYMPMYMDVYGCVFLICIIIGCVFYMYLRILRVHVNMCIYFYVHT